MPRRPSKKSKNAGAGKPRKVDRSDGKINKWNDRSDIVMDEEDQFHASRDQILLDGDGEAEGDIEDDEVFALQGISDDDEEEEEEEEGEGEEDMETPNPASKSKSKSKSKGKGKDKEKELLDSDEDEEEEEEETWGRGKAAYYSSNAAQIDSDDEEAIQLEEQEAKRLRAKSREDLNDDDFGLQDPIEVTATDNADVLEDLPPRPVLQDKTAILGHLQKTDPESLALAGDWTDSATSLVRIKQKLEQLESEQGSKKTFMLGMQHLHYQTLLTYTTTLAFYLHLRASQKYAQKPELLRSHPIMQRLLKLKQALITLEDLDFAASDDEDDGDDLDEAEDEEEDFGHEYLDMDDEDDIMRDARELWSKDHDNEDGDVDVEVDSEELDDLLADARSGTKPIAIPIPEAPSLTAPPKKKRKTAPGSGKASIPIFDLVEPEFESKSKSKASSSSNSKSHSASTSTATDAFGEATSLQHADALDKTARRKTLRFHTSRIENASARRNNARSNALGGDDDIPYRERRKEKEERLAKEAKAHLRSQGGADLDDTEPEPRQSEQGGDDGDEDVDGYYDLVKKKAKEKKEKKKAEYDASQQDRYVDSEEAGTGPRSLTRAILANKGLTPHRPKSVRNPRVKKRLRFDKAQKKVASQKAVYKGGVSATGGRYEGEKSGISKVVKSVRLG